MVKDRSVPFGKTNEESPHVRSGEKESAAWVALCLAASIIAPLVPATAATASAERPAPFLESGFEVGCNYWASHAGMYMWRDWKPQVVEADFDRLAACGVTVLRVFPLWPDFQPLTADLTCHAVFQSWSQADGPLRNEAAVDDEMVRRFRFMCDAAQKRGMKLVVGLVTGWMSGRLFAPACLSFKDPLVDPDSIMWQTRYVKYLVTALRDHPAIAAWDLGNECDCMGAGTPTEFRNWMLMISNTIRVADPTRPVVSGLHGVKSDPRTKSSAHTQAETIDILTTHPYPLWTPNCNVEPFDTMRNGCHAACETVWYADMAGKPAFVEEAGSMGPGIVSEARAAAMMRASLFSCWASGIRAYVWWCAFDQNRLPQAPYDWTAIERELGLFTADGQPKPTVLQMKAFKDYLKTLPFAELPARRIDATVIVSENENTWPVAQGAWLLARKAGFDIRYAMAERPLPESSFYILPSGSGYRTYSAAAWHRLRDRVRAGATVLISLGRGAVLSEFEETVGARVENHYRANQAVAPDFGADSFTVGESHRRILTPTTAKVLVKDRATGAPVVLENALDKGRVIYFNAALEQSAMMSGWPVYRLAAERAGVKRRVTAGVRTVGLTEHPAKDGTLYVVAVNYEPKAVKCPLTVDGQVRKVYGAATFADGTLALGANDGCVLEIAR